jgi:hypothetical protein
MIDSRYRPTHWRIEAGGFLKAQSATKTPTMVAKELLTLIVNFEA